MTKLNRSISRRPTSEFRKRDGLLSFERSSCWIVKDFLQGRNTISYIRGRVSLLSDVIDVVIDGTP
jgi:hypothetical protein